MEQFSLEKYLENPSRKIVTRDGREVEIFYSDTSKAMLVGRISATEIHQYTKDGFQCDTINQAKNDLFFADDEEESQSTEFSFGAFDSEFVRDEYLIPEGCEARIEGNKVIIEKIQKEEELTEFEQVVKACLIDAHASEYINIDDEYAKKVSKEFLELARKQLNQEMIEALRTEYEKGKADVLNVLPK